MLGEGRPRTIPFGPKRKVGRPKKIHRNLELAAAIKEEKSRYPEYGPKRRVGRPRKPVDYTVGYVPPLPASAFTTSEKKTGHPGTKNHKKKVVEQVLAQVLGKKDPFFNQQYITSRTFNKNGKCI